MKRSSAALVVAIAGLATPAPSQNPSPTDSRPASRRFASLAEVDRWVQEQRLAALEAYVADAKEDRADAMTQVVQVAIDLSRWDRVKVHAEAYLREFPSGEAAKPMRFVVVKALAKDPAHTEEARKECLKLLEECKDDTRTGVMAGVTLSELLLDAGNVEEAKNALIDLIKRFATAEGLSDYLQPRLMDLDEIGKEPKAIEVRTIDDKPFKLADWKGRIVLIDFWATAVPQSLAELPTVQAAYKKYHDQGFEVVGICLDQDEQGLRDFVKQHAIAWPIHLDKGEVAQAYRVTDVPRSYLIDRDGKVHRIGLQGDELGSAVDRLLGRAAASRPAAAPDKK